MNRTVLTKYGAVSGIASAIPKFTAFKGIPYAKPPVGELRWRAPMEPERWEGARACDRFPPACVQSAQEKGSFYETEFFQAGYEVSEDCLYLNVWADLEKRNQPVMVWIHGGAFDHGFGHEMEFDGDAFAKRGVILVTVNYRLGAFGFLAHPALTERDGHSGNYGLMDQIAALKWVSDNIFAFGGDAGSVTIFGQSAGAASVQALMTSTPAAGLFLRAIYMSAGTPLLSIGGGLSQEDAEQTGLELCAALNVGLDGLYEADAAAILRGAADLKGGLRFRPCMDKYVLAEDPGEAFARGAARDASFMLGSVTGDSSLFGDAAKDMDERAEAMTAAYAKTRVAQGKGGCYVYHFRRDIPGDDRPRAFHSSELWYVFGTLHRSDRPFTGLDYDLSRRMTDWWANFARTGDPGGGFTAYGEDNPAILEIGEEVKMADIRDRPLANRISNELFDRIRKQHA